VISYNIKWFLGLSVAVHTAALIAWSQHDYQAGHSGQVLLLSVNNQTGAAVVQPQSPAASQPGATPDAPPVQPPAELSPPAVASTAKQQQTEHATPSPVIATAATPSHSTLQPQQTSQVAQAASTVTRKNQDRHLRASVMELIASKLNYPAIARRKGWQGVVRLELRIEADGRISNLQIDATSGYSVLDEAALQSLQLANVPDATQWLGGRAIDLIVPVEYRLIDG